MKVFTYYKWKVAKNHVIHNHHKTYMS